MGPGDVGVVREDRGADHQHEVVTVQRLAQRSDGRRQDAVKLRMAFGKADPPPTRSRGRPDRQSAALGQRDARVPAAAGVDVGPGDHNPVLGPPGPLGKMPDDGRIGLPSCGDRALGRGVGGVVVRLGAPIVHRDRDEHRTARRPSAAGTSCALGTSYDHLTSGWGMRAASRFVRLACIVMWARTCWPAVTRSGDLFAWALKIAPIPFPTPGAVWRLTWVT